MKKVIAIVLCCIVVATCFLCISCTEEDNTPKIEINVMSFNIRQDVFIDGNIRDWSSYRGEKVINYLLEKGADVITMQEVKKNQASDLEEGLSSLYEVIYYSRTTDDSDTEGLAIAYKKDKFNLVNEGMFWLSETPLVQSKGWGASYYRICVTAPLEDKETGVDFEVFDVHLDVNVQAAREGGIQLVLDTIEERGNTSVVCGDFNAMNTETCYEIIANKMTDAQSSAGGEYGITYNGYGSLAFSPFISSVDFIFFESDVFKVNYFDILTDTEEVTKEDGTSATFYYSDHYAVLSNVYLYY